MDYASWSVPVHRRTIYASLRNEKGMKRFWFMAFLLVAGLAAAFT
jgi:hypothetical protein